MNGASDRQRARDERRRLRDERRAAARRCDSLAYAVRGPITLITVGVLFALSNFKGIGFEKTWPVLLIVFGLFTLLGRGTEPERPAQPVAAPGPPPAGNWPPEQPQPGGYRQSGYATPPPESRPDSRQADQGATPPEGGAL